MLQVNTGRAAVASRPTVECRPSGLVVSIAVLLLGLCGIGCWLASAASAAPDDSFLQTIGSGPFLWMMVLTAASGIGAGFWAWRARVVADENGIRYRRWSGWHEAAWNQMRDFYDLPVRDPGLDFRSNMAIAFGSERLVLPSKQWGNLEELRWTVSRYSLAAPARE